MPDETLGCAKTRAQWPALNKAPKPVADQLFRISEAERTKPMVDDFENTCTAIVPYHGKRIQRHAHEQRCNTMKSGNFMGIGQQTYKGFFVCITLKL